MNSLRNALTIYLATDDMVFKGPDSVAEVLRAVEGGVTMVQLRMKSASAAEIFDAGRVLLEKLRPLSIPLIINDRVDIMLALDADGVHVGRNDLPLDKVRRLAGKRIVGYSVNTLEHLKHAESNGADYVGVGPIFNTGTKLDTGPVLGTEGLRAIVRQASVPCVAIGGINCSNAASVRTAGATGCCTVSAILAAPDACKAARNLRTAFLGR